jgi:hypothetical protein
MSTVHRLTVLSLCAAATAAVAYAQDTGDTGVVPVRGMITLTDPLNERADGEYYCLDIFGSTVEDGDGMQVHTCKVRPRPAEDMDFTVNAPSLGYINVTQADDLCVTMQRPRAESRLNVLACSSTDTNQQWISDAAGEIHPASDTTLCLTVADTRMCGNPGCTNYKRILTLETCAGLDTKYITWTIPGGSIGL